MTIHHYAETATPDATKRYPSDLNDREFDLVAPHVAQKAGSDKKRIVDIREVLNATAVPPTLRPNTVPLGTPPCCPR